MTHLLSDSLQLNIIKTITHTHAHKRTSQSYKRRVGCIPPCTTHLLNYSLQLNTIKTHTHTHTHKSVIRKMCSVYTTVQHTPTFYIFVKLLPLLDTRQRNAHHLFVRCTLCASLIDYALKGHDSGLALGWFAGVVYMCACVYVACMSVDVCVCACVCVHMHQRSSSHLQDQDRS